MLARMGSLRAAATVVVTVGIVALAAPAVSAAATHVPRPVAGHYKIEKQFSSGVVGSLVVNKAGSAVTHVSLTPTDPTYCAGKILRFQGPFHLYNIADARGGANDNTPDWAITKKHQNSRKVTARQGGVLVHGTLSLSFGSKNGTRKPVKYVEGDFTSASCTVDFGGIHG
jgi:hypothetical protein